MTHPMEHGRDDLVAMSRAVTEYVADFVAGLDAAPTSGAEVGAALRKILLDPPEDGPSDLRSLLATIGAAASSAVETAGPRYAAYIPGGGLLASALGEFLACSVNRYTALAGLAPGLVALEHGVLRWLCDEFGLPGSSGGVVTTGGSMGTLSAVVAARSGRLGGHFADGAIYVTAHAHHCVAKAARIAGFPDSCIRVVPATRDLRMNVDAASRMIVEDRERGLRPFFIVANAGSTDTGTVDPIHDIGQLAAREGLWFHVDGAYGGFFQLTRRGSVLLSGIQQADSVVLDPHKSLFLPYGTGILLVRDVASLRAAYSGSGSYLQDLDNDLDLPDFAALGPELTRGCRGLRLWLPLHLYGVGAFRDALDEKLDLAAYAYRDLLADTRLELPRTPDLSTVEFRPRHGGDDASLRLLGTINGTGRTFLSSTRIGGRVTLRLCILSYRTHREHVDQILQVIHDAVAELSVTNLAEARPPGRASLGLSRSSTGDR